MRVQLYVIFRLCIRADERVPELLPGEAETIQTWLLPKGVRNETGRCSTEDQKLLKERSAAYEPQDSFCGRKATSWMRISASEYSACLADAIPVSAPCLSCFEEQAAFAAAKCKLPCLLSWSSKRCLRCRLDAEELSACTGLREDELPRVESRRPAHEGHHVLLVGKEHLSVPTALLVTDEFLYV